ncbi:hypothetical protein BHE74_00008858 [Ensete ventricosum]|nr:hypothetical protein GW17_00001583 [Ensete ventricosum]RWW82668.1 hypothetical protein BHE74_00008858 [Ensete ventricosum]RZR77725.1 hypothetical protein BHM03_00002876 [Ensete ventricosum]
MISLLQRRLYHRWHHLRMVPPLLSIEVAPTLQVVVAFAHSTSTRCGRSPLLVAYEFRYQIAIGRFKVRYPELKINEGLSAVVWPDLSLRWVGAVMFPGPFSLFLRSAALYHAKLQ